jgi:hypothetical protein
LESSSENLLPKAKFRSGNAGGDFYFSQGVLQVAPERLQVITPTKTTVKSNNAYETISHSTD